MMVVSGLSDEEKNAKGSEIAKTYTSKTEIRGIDEIPKPDEPFMLFIYWSDKNDQKGSNSDLMDFNAWNSEECIKLAEKFHCFSIDAKNLDQKLLKSYKIVNIPSVVFLDRYCKYIQTIDDIKITPAVMKSVMQKILEKDAKSIKKYNEIVEKCKAKFEQAKEAVASNKDKAIRLLKEIIKEGITLEEIYSQALDFLKIKLRAEAEKYESEGKKKEAVKIYADLREYTNDDEYREINSKINILSK